MQLRKYLLGILLKAKLQNLTFDSRLVDVPSYPDNVDYDHAYDDNVDYNSVYNGNVDYHNVDYDFNMTENMEQQQGNGGYVTYTTEASVMPPPRKMYPQRLIEMINRLKQQCFRQLALPSVFEKDEVYCNRTMDKFAGCWPDTAPGDIAVISCPELPAFNTKNVATKECTINGTWWVNATTGKEWANYSACFRGEEVYTLNGSFKEFKPSEIRAEECKPCQTARNGSRTTNKSENTDHAKYIYIFIGGFTLSLVMLLLSLFIFLWFRQLRCDRITIHKNLFASYVLTGISWLTYYSSVALNGDVQIQNPIWCQAVHVLCQYFTVCNFFWMFCEGLYLNTIMVFAFNSGKIVIPSCYVIGWVIPVILTIIYTCIRGNDELANKDCWISESNLQWIVYGPIVFSIAVNVLFLINIVRLLITKLRQMPEADQTKKATRATLILVPLLGLQYLLFPIRPEPGSDLEDIYHIMVALLVSLQGAFVSLMYCFCNGEVIAVLRRKWNQHTLMSKSSMRASAMQGTTYTSIGTTYSTAGPLNTGHNSNNCYNSTENKDSGLEMVPIDTKDA